jgi:adenosine deaminase
VDDNLTALTETFGLSEQTLATLARNSFTACFAAEDDKRRWLAEVDAWVTSPR